eukprot:TRINITY_DN12866_c0_g1_i1.p1 TRINITY_DN12866_c0_g1~~TRINITY_DN12866_c0_g1_i1.p1  ORF type:complete len:670 (-),score=72.91 TRINITY_DN12866_c0_g1_i1:1227-3215(-)
MPSLDCKWLVLVVPSLIIILLFIQNLSNVELEQHEVAELPPDHPVPDKPLAIAPNEVEFISYENASMWITGQITFNGPPFTVFSNPPLTSLTQPLFSLPRPYLDKGNKTLGTYSIGFVFCEFWTITYPAFLGHCLPRFLKAYPQVLQEFNTVVPVFVPGESFVLQFLVEVLGVPEHLIVPFPAHLLWNMKFANLFISFRKLIYAPPALAPSLPEALDRVRRAVEARLPQMEPPPTPLIPHSKGTEPFIMFSERPDMSMPADSDVWLGNLSKWLPNAAVIYAGRLETLRIIHQIYLARAASALFGPAGNNLINLCFMQRGSTVVEMFSGQKPSTSDGLNYLTPKRWSQVKELAQAFGLQYHAVLPRREQLKQSQPVFALTEVGTILAGVVPLTGGKGAALLRFSAPLLGCEKLFHKSKFPHLMGLYKQTYITPDFALKIARTGDWKRVLKEMVLLRNLSEPVITPPVALCFDRRMYAQRLVTQLGHQGQVRAERWPDHRMYFAAVAGYLHIWHAHRARGRFLFYCDPGPKNFGVTRDADIGPNRPLRLQMYDFDVTALIPPGALCHRETDCGCDAGGPRACVRHRCTRDGMQAKVDRITRGFLSTLIRLYSPQDLFRNDPRTREIIKLAKANAPIPCPMLVDYVAFHEPDIAADLPMCNGTSF